MRLFWDSASLVWDSTELNKIFVIGSASVPASARCATSMAVSRSVRPPCVTTNCRTEGRRPAINAWCKVCGVMWRRRLMCLRRAINAITDSLGNCVALCSCCVSCQTRFAFGKYAFWNASINSSGLRRISAGRVECH